MNKETETILIDDLNVNALSDTQVTEIYNKLSDADKNSTDNLNNAKEQTETSEYSSEDNNIIEASEEIPGVDVIPSSAIDNIEVKNNDLKEILDNYDLDDESIIQMLKIIDDYRADNTITLYPLLPPKMKHMVDNILLTETNGNMNLSYNQINNMKNGIAKMLVDSFINDAKISTVVDDFNSEMANTMNEMNAEYDNLLINAIDGVFNKIDEIKDKDPEQAARIESIKEAFDSASTFDRQLDFAKHTSNNKFKKYLDRYENDIFYFNKKVNSNSIGVKVNDIDELVPIIKIGLPQYTEDDIKKFIICICRTINDVNELNEIAYQYRLVSSIYKYKFVNIDEAGETIFKNISKVIDVIIS